MFVRKEVFNRVRDELNSTVEILSHNVAVLEEKLKTTKTTMQNKVADLTSILSGMECHTSWLQKQCEANQNKADSLQL